MIPTPVDLTFSGIPCSTTSDKLLCLNISKDAAKDTRVQKNVEKETEEEEEEKKEEEEMKFLSSTLQGSSITLLDERFNFVYNECYGCGPTQTAMKFMRSILLGHSAFECCRFGNCFDTENRNIFLVVSLSTACMTKNIFDLEYSLFFIEGVDGLITDFVILTMDGVKTIQLCSCLSDEVSKVHFLSLLRLQLYQIWKECCDEKTFRCVEYELGDVFKEAMLKYLQSQKSKTIIPPSDARKIVLPIVASQLMAIQENRFGFVNQSCVCHLNSIMQVLTCIFLCLFECADLVVLVLKALFSIPSFHQLLQNSIEDADIEAEDSVLSLMQKLRHANKNDRRIPSIQIKLIRLIYGIEESIIDSVVVSEQRDANVRLDDMHILLDILLFLL